MWGRYGTKSSNMLLSIRCSEYEVDLRLNQVICCLPLDVWIVRKFYGTKLSDMLPSIGCSESEDDMRLNQVICCRQLDVHNVRMMWDWTKWYVLSYWTAAELNLSRCCYAHCTWRRALHPTWVWKKSSDILNNNITKTHILKAVRVATEHGEYKLQQALT